VERLIIYESNGYELEKAQPNTSEDFFNRSEVVYEVNGVKHKTAVLYLRYFEEQLSTFSDLTDVTLYENGEESIHFCDTVALAMVLKNPNFIGRKRIYINEMTQFSKELEGVNYEQLVQYIRGTKQNANKKVHIND
jgi:hypothetical protein